MIAGNWQLSAKTRFGSQTLSNRPLLEEKEFFLENTIAEFAFNELKRNAGKLYTSGD